METISLSIAEHTYYLSSNADIATLLQELTDAVREGGQMVQIPTVGDSSVLAMVSPGFPVILETRTVPDPDNQLGPTSLRNFLFDDYEL